MHLASLILSYALAALIVLSVLVYAPLAKNWTRALIIPAIVTLMWGGVRTVSIVIFREPEPALFGFIVAPFLSALYAALIRQAKLLLCEIPTVNRWEKVLRAKMHKGGNSDER